MAEDKPAAVPLVEQLRSIPIDAKLRIDTPNALGCMDTRSIPVGRLCHEAADQMRALMLQAVKDERERCAAQIPTTWLDPLLTGPRGMGQPPFSCQDIERLLKRLASAIRSLPDPD